MSGPYRPTEADALREAGDRERRRLEEAHSDAALESELESLCDEVRTPEEAVALRAFAAPVREAIRKAYAAGVAEGRLEAEQAADERIRELEAKVLGATIFSEADKQLVERALAVQGLLRTPGFLELVRDVEQPRRDRIETDDGPVELRDAPR